MGDREVSQFHIHGFTASISSTTPQPNNFKSDHAIQTIWEPVSRGASEKHCKVVVMDYTSYWEGVLMKKDWEEQRQIRCEDMVNRSLYESLTRDAFKGVAKNEGDRWDLSLSVRPCKNSLDDLELTWAGSVTNNVGGKETKQKTVLGTMILVKVPAEESKTILRQWIRTTIDERQKIKVLSEGLKETVANLDRQYSECRELLEDFKESKLRAQDDMLEKFRLLINTKKEKIGQLVKANTKLEDKIEKLQTALREERRQKAILEGKDVPEDEIDLVDIKEKHESDQEDSAAAQHGAGRGKGRGRGRRRGRGRGRGRGADVVEEDSDDESPEPKKSTVRPRRAVAMKAHDTKAQFEDAEEPGREELEPLPHPQDGYGWDKDETDAQDNEDREEESLVRRGPRQAQAGSGASSSKDHHGGAQNIMNRVTKAVNFGSIKGSSPSESASSSRTSSPAPPYSKTHVIKREESDSANKLLLANHQNNDRSNGNSDDDGDVPMKIEPKDPMRGRIVAAVRKRHREGSNDSSRSHTSMSDTSVRKSPTETSSRRVIGIRKSGTIKVSAMKHTFEATPGPSLRSEPSNEGQGTSIDPKRQKLSRLKDSDATPFSVEELFKGME